MASNQSPVKPWAGRFAGETHAFVEEFTQSVSFDRRLYRQDIQGSIAHVRMLAHCGVLPEDDAGRIVKGLESILSDIEADRFQWRVELEDVHMNIESALAERIGDVGKKLHTARSRNDQVATDLRLYLRDAMDELRALLLTLLQSLCALAEREAETIMPGVTHMQTAQPVTFGHHLLAWCAMLQRDEQRLLDCRRRTNVLPLGAAALAGTGFPIDREYAARLLGFDRVAENSLDAVSDRDFAVEFCGAAALIMMHLSRFAEELVLWSSPQYCFIELDEAWCTGSSIMPQKKNPDVAELLRGKTGRVYGDLMALLTLMKGQPLAYNRDNQEDKEALFDAVDTVRNCLRACCGMLPGLRVQREAMVAAAARGQGTATDLADYLVGRGVPFRDAHAIVGRVVQFAIGAGKDLSELNIEELRRFSGRIESDVFARLTLQGSVAARDHVGGTAPRQVRLAAQRLREYLRQALAQEISE
ncbi:MAG: argininosuccinate lyase [Gammaproteobacteria bacterium]|nr:argininosuccinate lyase [Gammaproteobacteria bacterium]